MKLELDHLLICTPVGTPEVDELVAFGLTSEQLALRAAPHLRSIGEIVTHIIGARARWFYQLMGEGGDIFATLGTWDRPGMPARSAAELIEALETTGRGCRKQLATGLL